MELEVMFVPDSINQDKMVPGKDHIISETKVRETLYPEGKVWLLGEWSGSA